MNILKDKSRIAYLDIARGIAIILMIMGHVCETGWKRKIIFSFHMPLFIIISGMFFKENETLKRNIIKMIKKLLIPYALAIIVGNVLQVLIYNKNINALNVIEQLILAYSNKKSYFQNIAGVNVLWFIPFLFVIRIEFYLINKFTENTILKGMICLLFTMVGIYLTKINIFLPWSLDITFATIIFYYIGYSFKKYHLLEKILNDYKIIICILAIYYVGLKFGHIELAIRSYPYGFICYITAIAGTLLVFQLSKVIEKHMMYLTKILSWFGKMSMYILCFHYLDRTLINYKDLGLLGKTEIFLTELIIITIATLILENVIRIIQSKYKKGNERE